MIQKNKEYQFSIQHGRLVIQFEEEEITFDEDVTRRLHNLLTRKLYGEYSVIISGGKNES